jgi:uncharacterized protein (TIGR03435 family)
MPKPWSTVLMLILATTTTILAQSTAPAFDVTSIRRFRPDPNSRPSDAIRVMPGGRLIAPSATVRGLIAAAYAVLDIQIIDGGRINGDDRFEIDARTRPDVAMDEARGMLRALLAERFGLITRRETRELAVYAMMLAGDRPGSQLRPSGPECALPKGPPGIPAPPPPPASQEPAPLLVLNSTPSRCALIAFNSTLGGHWSLREITMERLAQRLTAALGRPVFDRSGLNGPFDVDLTFTPDNPTRAPVDVLVVDRVQPPTQN